MACDTPAFPFYPRDFLADTVHLSAEEIGAYWLILCAAWNSERPGYLPNDQDLLQRIGRLDARRWARAGGAIMGLLKSTQDGKWLYSKRMVAERDKQLAFREQASAAGKRGAQTRAQRKVIGASGTLGYVEGTHGRPLNDHSTEAQRNTSGTSTRPPTKSNSASASAFASSEKAKDPEKAYPPGARARVMDAWSTQTGNLIANASSASDMVDLVLQAATRDGREPEVYIAAFVAWVESCPAERKPQKAPHKFVEHFAAVQEWVRGERQASPTRKYKNFSEPRPHIPETYDEDLTK